jgi:5'-nucleotidase
VKILTSNDDGIEAIGNKSLREALALSHKVVTIVPDRERSSCGHGLSLGKALRMKKVSESLFSCSGQPADCILLGLGHILRDDIPDIVIAGINHGANLGQDRYYSGTIAAAREGAFRGIPAIAVSLCQQPGDDSFEFDQCSLFVKKLVDGGIGDKIPRNSVLNINYPNIKAEKINGVKYTISGWQEYTDEIIERVDNRDKPYYWLGGRYKGHTSIEGSDGNAIAEGFISLNLQSSDGTVILDHDLENFLSE